MPQDSCAPTLPSAWPLTLVPFPCVPSAPSHPHPIPQTHPDLTPHPVASHGLHRTPRLLARSGRSMPPLLDLNLTLLDAAGAVCLDGSPGGFYYAPARSPRLAHKWVVELQGGGWCYSPLMCWRRGQTWGSSKAWPAVCGGAGPEDACKAYGPLAADVEVNPDFALFHRVHLQYCDGGSFLGDRTLETPYGLLHFRGRRILRAAIEKLQRTFGLGAVDGTEVLLTGCSAGGHAVVHNADYIRSLLPPTVRTFKAMAGSGFFVALPNAEGVPVYEEEMRAVVEMQGLEAALSPSCLAELPADAPPYRCFLAELAVRHVAAPLFLIDSILDEYQLLCTLTANPPANATFYMAHCAELWPCLRAGWGARLSSCTAAQIRAVAAFGAAALARLRGSGANGAFVTSCHTHCAFENYDWRRTFVSAPDGESVSMQAALGRWWRDGGGGGGEEHTYWPCTLGVEASSLQCNPTCPEEPPPPPPPHGRVPLHGKAVYFALVDRFARSDAADAAPCAADEWCGGTLDGLRARLDYIAAMGFEYVWITPVVAQYRGRDGPSGTAYHGYWAKRWYEVDEHFGSAASLLALSRELHARGMGLILDVVINHGAPVHSAADVHSSHPFNRTEFYHTLRRQPTESFSEYARHPANALDGFPPGYGPGDYSAEGYDEVLIEQGWFYYLADLNQQHPFVASELRRWVRHLVHTYEIDALRLDTAPYVPRSYLARWARAAEVPVLGEVTSSNLSFHASYTRDQLSGARVLSGVLNFPLFYELPHAFCGKPPTAAALFGGDGDAARVEADMRPLARLLVAQGLAAHEKGGGGSAVQYDNVDLLGNFIDNHDVSRFRTACGGGDTHTTHALALVMLLRGVPVVYAGTEQGVEGAQFANRVGMWQTGYDTTAPLYRWLTRLNNVRRAQKLGTSTMTILLATNESFVFQRHASSSPFATRVFLNNLSPNTSGPLQYCLPADGTPLDEAPTGMEWVNELTGSSATFAPLPGRAARRGRHCFLPPDLSPQVLVLRQVSSSGTLLAIVLAAGAASIGATVIWRAMIRSKRRVQSSGIMVAELRHFDACATPNSGGSESPPPYFEQGTESAHFDSSGNRI